MTVMTAVKVIVMMRETVKTTPRLGVRMTWAQAEEVDKSEAELEGQGEEEEEGELDEEKQARTCTNG